MCALLFNMTTQFFEFIHYYTETALLGNQMYSGGFVSLNKSLISSGNNAFTFQAFVVDFSCNSLSFRSENGNITKFKGKPDNNFTLQECP